MTSTMNGSESRTRKTLASQLDRLDALLDGLAEGLNEAVADAVKAAVGAAAQEALNGVLAEALARQQAAPVAAPVAVPMPVPVPAAPPGPTLRQRLTELLGGVRAALARVRAACGAGCSRLRGRAGGLLRAVALRLSGLAPACRAGYQFRYRLAAAAGVGAAVGVAAWFAGPWLASVAAGLGGSTVALAVQAWLWLRRAMTPQAGPAA